MSKVIPLSHKAKNRFANILGNNPEVTLEQRVGNKVFFVSSNGKYCAWADLEKDPDWLIVLP